MPTTPKRPISFYYATVGPISRAALRAAREYLDIYEEFGSPEMLFEYERTRDVVHGVADEAARLLHCDAGEVTFIPNTTYGINVASHALPLNEGDEIVVQSNEYKTNYWPWVKMCGRGGYRVREIKTTDNARGFEELLAAISPKTKVVAVSWIQYYDGYISDLDRLSAACHAQGAYLFVDAVQGIGVRALDLTKTRVDMLASGSQKYLCAGPGGGFLYVNKKIMGELCDAFVGIRSMSPTLHGEYALKDGAERFQTGTIDLQAAAQLHAALKEVNDAGIKNIEKQNLKLLWQCKKMLSENDITFIDHGDNQGNIISLTVPNPKSLVDFLAKDRIYIKAIHDVARISFHHNSTMEEFTELVKKICEWRGTKNSLPHALISATQPPL